MVKRKAGRRVRLPHLPCWIAALLLAPCAGGQETCPPRSPCYSADGIVNAASFERGPLAPYAIASLFGTGLAEEQGPPSAQVVVNGLVAVVFYASPLQINFLIPSSLLPGEATVTVIRSGLSGPPVRIRIEEAAPALFQMDPDTAVALRHPDWLLATREAPARPGEFVSLYATGLGRLDRPVDDYSPPGAAIEIARKADLRILLDGEPVAQDRVWYAGCAPDFSGLNQIDVKLPETAGPNPEIRLSLAGRLSPAGVHLPIAH